MTKVFFFILLVTFYLNSIAQIPSTKETIQNFIDSIGRSNDRQVITSSIFPAFANGTNFKWRINMWRNNYKNLLWVEVIIPDSISTVFFYCKDNLIFASERTYTLDSVSNKHRSIFRNIFFSQSKIIDDSSPGRNNNSVDYYLSESKKYLELSKKAD
jgi:hypothetical protein